jgi:hypothetical protein
MDSHGVSDETGGGSTITLLQNLEILAVDQLTVAPEENMVDTKELRSVTLLVTPAEAARLDLGQNKGTLRLTLRNPTDELTAFVTPVTLAGLHRDPSEPDEEQRESVEAKIDVLLATPTTAPAKRKFTPRIRTLRGTRLGIFSLLPSEDAQAEETEPDLPSSEDVPTEEREGSVSPALSTAAYSGSARESSAEFPVNTVPPERPR